jgi:hypothetical protein
MGRLRAPVLPPGLRGDVRGASSRCRVFEAEEVEPDREEERLDLDLVVCTRLIACVEDHTPSWVELYPDSETHSVVSVLGEHSTVEKIQLSDLLSITDGRNVDRAKRSSQPG